MKVFDCHIHVEKGLDNYNIGSERKNIIFNSIDSYQANAAKFCSNPDNSLSLIFDYKQNFNFILNEVNNNKVNALKVHSRIQQLDPNDYEDLIKALQKIDIDIPVIIDAFYTGTPLAHQPNLEKIIEIITRLPKKKFIIAHSGGHKLLDYFFHLRGFQNVIYDLSFSLQYLYDSSVFMDLKKLIKFTDKKRIMFGSDYPFADPAMQLEILNNLLSELNINDEVKEDIFYNNALMYFFHDPIQ